MIVRMIKILGKRMEAQTEKIQEMFKKELQDLKNKWTLLNNTISEMKNTLEEINSKIYEADEWVTDLENRMME